MAVSPGSRAGIEVALLVGVTFHTARATFFTHKGDAGAHEDKTFR